MTLTYIVAHHLVQNGKPVYAIRFGATKIAIIGEKGLVRADLANAYHVNPCGEVPLQEAYVVNVDKPWVEEPTKKKKINKRMLLLI
jgi:hypothetical protein